MSAEHAGRPTILLNALFLDPGVSGGPGTVLHGLAPALRELRPDTEIVVATTRRGAAALHDRGWPALGIDLAMFPCDDGDRIARQWAEQVLLPVYAARQGADLVHSLASIGPIRVPSAPHVVTVHDVTFIHHRTFGAVTTWGLTRLVPRTAHNAQALIADTAVARDDICRVLGIDPARFAVVPLGIDRSGRPAPTPEDELRARLELEGDRILMCVSAKRPHKNQEVLIRALRELPADLRLVLIGHPEPYDQVLRSLVAEHSLTKRVTFTDWINDADLEGMWAAASVAAVPSRAEGFGLPLIEAIDHGVPVAASEIPVLREVGGGIPQYFATDDPAAAAGAILSAIANPPDPAAARAWAERFTWESAARQTWEIYDAALAERA